MKLLTLSDLKHFWANAVQKIPIKISDLQDDVDMLTSHEDLHLENLPNESPNIRFINNSPQVTWNEHVYYDPATTLISGPSYEFDDETSLTSKTKIGYTNSSNSQNTVEHIYGQTYGATKAFFTMKYYYGSNEKNAEEDESCTINSSLVFTLDPNYESAGADTYYDESNAQSDVSPNNTNYHLGALRPFNSLHVNDVYCDNINQISFNGVLQALTSFGTHTEDTDKHVTTADKNKWNNQTYVFRYSSTALVASSTNSNTLLDNTDNLKVGDKVIDSSGVLFSITAIDTANSTFTIGTALIDLAQDSNVVHKSGNETIGGVKTFNSDITLQGTTTPVIKTISNIVQDSTGGNESISWVIRDKTDSNTVFSQSVNKFSGQSVDYRLDVTGILNGTSTTRGIRIVVDPANASYRFTSSGNNTLDLGSSTNNWRSVYAMNYYYGSNNVEFSTKFVTSDTAQTITETKTFTNTIKSQKEIEFTGNRLAYILPQFSAGYSGLSLCTYGSNGAIKLGTWKVDDNDNTKHVLNDSLGYLNISAGSSNSVNIVYLTPRNASKAKLGDSVNKWHEINGVEPSSLSLPSGNVSDFIDISSYFTNTGTGEFNTYPVTANGWIFLRLSSLTGCQTEIYDSSNNKLYSMSTSGSLEQIMIPVVSGVTLKTQWATGSAVTVNIARFIPCQGNV